MSGSLSSGLLRGAARLRARPSASGPLTVRHDPDEAEPVGGEASSRLLRAAVPLSGRSGVALSPPATSGAIRRPVFLGLPYTPALRTSETPRAGPHRPGLQDAREYPGPRFVLPSRSAMRLRDTDELARGSAPKAASPGVARAGRASARAGAAHPRRARRRRGRRRLVPDPHGRLPRAHAPLRPREAARRGQRRGGRAQPARGSAERRRPRGRSILGKDAAPSLRHAHQATTSRASGSQILG